MQYFDSVWLWDDSVSSYVNNTNESGSAGGTVFEILAQANDDLYLGDPLPFKGFICDAAAVGNYTGLTYRYWTGDTWEQLVPLVDYTFNEDKYLIIRIPNNWTKRTLNDTAEHAVATLPDNGNRYWLKIEATSITTAATINQILCIPQTMYSSPDKVAKFLQIKSTFTDETRPSITAVQYLIQRAEDRIDFRARKSWRFNFAIDELYDYNRYGFKLRHPDILSVYSVSIWNGSEWDTLTEGRNNDYFIEPMTGMIYFTRLFLLPAAYGMTGRYFHWGFGEYKKSVRVDYTWGRDFRIDPVAMYAEDIATRMVAADIVRSSDYTILMSSGVDKVALESKIRSWEADIEEKINEITGVFIY